MTTVTLNIPTEKVQSFLAMMVQNGFTRSGNFLKSQTQQFQSFVMDKRNAHPYFDWDFYNNELEYE